jgi:hypothetical protein
LHLDCLVLILHCATLSCQESLADFVAIRVQLDATPLGGSANTLEIAMTSPGYSLVK